MSLSLTVAHQGKIEVAGSVSSKVCASVSVALTFGPILAPANPHHAVESATAKASAPPKGNLAASAIRVTPPFAVIAAEPAAAPILAPTIILVTTKAAAVDHPRSQEHGANPTNRNLARTVSLIVTASTAHSLVPVTNLSTVSARLSLALPVTSVLSPLSLFVILFE